MGRRRVYRVGTGRSGRHRPLGGTSPARLGTSPYIHLLRCASAGPPPTGVPPRGDQISAWRPRSAPRLAPVGGPAPRQRASRGYRRMGHGRLLASDLGYPPRSRRGLAFQRTPGPKGPGIQFPLARIQSSASSRLVTSP